ncbi:MAG TPA: alpha-amylase family glycosyl hydrolase [Burkholderiaceae bacterium]|nr:alpha-amylase family glycosyl hydrolase [Burkholderiaceae bacterium]
MKLFSSLGFALIAAVGAASAAPIDLSPVPARMSAVKLPRDWHRGVFMEVFVRAYQDSDGDGIGDLKGLISRLDYLKALGIRGLWLMPIQANADGDHGYATRDFRAVAPEYGTLEDFDALLREAGKRGIGVIIDYAVNHSAVQHPLFVEARSDAKSPWRDWFVFADEEPLGWDIWGKNPWYANRSESWSHVGQAKHTPRPPPGTRDWYFGTFGPGLPDFNLRNPQVVAYHEDSLRFWLNRGLAGYRLDATPHLIENDAKDWNDQPESRALTKRLADLIRSYPNRYVVCEATQKPQDWGDAKVCGGAFAFGHVHHYVKAAKGEAESVQALAEYFKTASPAMATFVSNHDIFAGRRLWDQVDGDVARYKLAAAGYLLQPGTPFVYYGEEVGQAGAVGPGMASDHPIRSPMSWTADPQRGGFTTGSPFRPLAPNIATHNAAAARADRASIYHFYRSMIALRNARPSIARGTFEHAFADGLVLGFQRRLGRERTLVLINYGRETATARVPGLAPRTRLTSLHGPRGTPLTLAPQSVRVFDLRR